MFVTKNKIPLAVTQQTEQAKKDFARLYNSTPNFNNMVPCVFVQQDSPRKYFIGWNWAKVGTKVGDVRIDKSAVYKEQEIVWVWEAS